MNREECENKILEKLKEIKAIAKKYDKSEELYLSMTITDDSIAMGNAHWETETPLDVMALDVMECNNERVIHFDH